MRADRLLSILILLQSRGKLTADALARELEVSPRTIYRDMDALSIAGFPVYADPGVGGGYALLGDYELELSGFNTRDIQALATLSVPDSLDEIGLGAGLRAALLKLLAALEEDPQRDHHWMRQRFLMDSPRSHSNRQRHSTLRLVQQAVWEDRLIAARLQYPSLPGNNAPLEITPLTLVSSGSRWYLIGARRDFTRVYPLSTMAEVTLLDKAFTRPADFDPRPVWQAWRDAQEKHEGTYPVTTRMKADLLDQLRQHDRWRVRIIEIQEKESDWLLVELVFDHFFQARTELLGLGAAVRVIEPEALRLSIIDYAKLISQLY
ncbi:WYL domain-containing protein [bacterium]|nr:WYL domain-containing protein [bacterium]